MTPEQDDRLRIRRATAAADDGRVAALAEMVNAAFRPAEAGMWVDGTERVTPEELRATIRDGELLLAEADGAPVGVVRVHPVDATTRSLGMLATDPGHRGRGIGRALVDAAEAAAIDAGATTMQLELLVPLDREHPAKRELARWYGALGYRRTGTEPLEEAHPALPPLLAEPCEFQIWRKPLDPAS